MIKWTQVMRVLLGIAIIVQFVMAVIAEHNEEYTKAIYEMIWAGVFLFFLKEDWNKND